MKRILALGLGLFVLPVAARAQIVEYYHVDAIGNVRAVTDQSGSIVERHDYLPFGEECTTGPCALNPGVGAGQAKKFTGKERDAETGFDYFGARYYGSKMGRFMSPDPAMEVKANLVNPQRWNRYAYALNNPLRYTDPDGRCAAPAGMGGGVGFCVEAFISSSTIGVVGLGDNREFSATNGELTFRARVQFEVDPGSGEVRGFVAQAGTSSVFTEGLGREGSLYANITNKKRTEGGDTTFTLNILALNGLAAMPTAPKDPIDINLNFVVTRAGQVGLAAGSNQTGYPSVGAYGYTDGGKTVKTIHERKEGKPSDLGAPKVQVPARRPM